MCLTHLPIACAMHNGHGVVGKFELLSRVPVSEHHEQGQDDFGPILKWGCFGLFLVIQLSFGVVGLLTALSHCEDNCCLFCPQICFGDLTTVVHFYKIGF